MKNAIYKFGLFLVYGLLAFTGTFAQSAEYDFVVAKDGSGDFTTVQSAINAVPDFRKKETVIYIKNGTYKEKLVLPASKTHVTFIGENLKHTVITNDECLKIMGFQPGQRLNKQILPF